MARLVLFELVPRPVDGYLFVCYAVGMRAAGPALVISSGEREALEVLARPSTAKHREVQRATTLPLSLDGAVNTVIAERVGPRPRRCMPGVNASTTRGSAG